ncbi:MAG: hypothetical protein PHR19_02515 [Bacteroidales bacterium]|nr:hypothetical protein [Bacteroidales bacterium]
MSRKLLEKIIDWYEKDSSVGGLSVIIDEIKEELAKPEHEPLGHLIRHKLSGESSPFNFYPIAYKIKEYRDEKIWEIIEVYTEPPKREQLSEEMISRDWSFWDDAENYHDFYAGVRYAEKAQGIGE